MSIISLSFLGGYSIQDLLNLRYFLSGLILIFIIGLLDDVIGLSFYVKLIGQTTAAILLVWGGCYIQSLSGPFGSSFNLQFLAIPFSVLWILLIINAINLLDGLDGLAAGIVLILTIGFVAIAFLESQKLVVLIGFSLIGSLLGFLKYNRHPAKIFMGDTGSLVLGYVVAYFSIEALQMAGSHQVSFVSALVILGVPLGDTLLSFVRRLFQGRNPFAADKNHIHHRLLNLGLRQKETAMLMYLFTGILTALGFFSYFFKGIFPVLFFMIALGLGGFWVWRLGYFETRYSYQNQLYQKSTGMPVTKRAPLHPGRIWHTFLLLLTDIFTLNLSLLAIYFLKFQSGLYHLSATRPITDYFTSPVFMLITLGWILLFFLNDLYSMPWDVSRFDKFLRVSKVITFGCLVLGLLTLDFSELLSQSQLGTLAAYWIVLIVFVNSGRIFIIGIEKYFKIFEYAPKKTLIIGANEISQRIIRDIRINPHLIYDVVGMIGKSGETNKMVGGYPILGDLTELPKIIHENKIEEAIIALEESETDAYFKILSQLDQNNVVIKILPGTKDVFTANRSGMMGHSFVRVFPENMVLWQWLLKRLIDISVSLILLVALSPLFLFVGGWGINRFKKTPFVAVPTIGRFAVPFKMIVFRLTHLEYHYKRNPVYIGGSHPSVKLSPLASWLSRKRLYKLPQIINVLLGDMSLVGPRPEIPEWHEENAVKIPFIYRRTLVRPGLTGLAQVKYHYEMSDENIFERTKFDIYYTENMSLRLDFRILLRTMTLLIKSPPKINRKVDL
ncbi:MAG: hypothetical protein Kow0037_20620 [Calditrichia bacterium]